MPKLSSPQVVSIGDCLIVMLPHRRGALLSADDYHRDFAGAELNACIGCSRLGVSAGLITQFSDDPFGRFARQRLLAEGIDAGQVAHEDKPMALMFKEILADGSFRVYYHRKQTAAAAITVTAAMENYVRGARAFLYTGIFPALSAVNLQTLNRLLEAAKRGGVLRVFDPNIRMKLLHTPARARRLLLPLAKQADVMLIGEEEAEMLYGVGEAEQLFIRLAQQGIHHVVLKRGDKGAIAVHHNRRYVVPAHPAVVVDTCGAGDAFNAGYLFALLKKWKTQRALEFAAWCAAQVVASDRDNDALPFAADINTAKAPR